MTFLPIVERELRVAGRKPSTFWMRVSAALVALLIGSAFLILSQAWAVGFGAPMLGRGLFAVLTWLNLGVALSAGLFFTSDCLSEEKREGTLGFLFLTDLSGYDVVLGKLLATSLRGFYALLAVFPILAVTVLMGGVTGAQLWRTSLALVNALFVSLAAGLFISAISRDSQKALAATLLLLVFLVAGGPATDAILAVVKENPFEPRLSLASPGYLFVTAGAWGRNPFWTGLLFNQIVAWMLLGLTCALLPRTWQEKAAKTSTPMTNWARWLRFGGIKRQARLRQELLGVNPVLWLACRERWQAIALWSVAIFMAAGFSAVFTASDDSMWWFAWSTFAGALTLAMYLGMASQAARFFVEAQRSGLIELLLATPLSAMQMVQGHWRALLRMFAPALALCLAVQLLGTMLVQEKTWSRFAVLPAPPVAPPATSTTITNSMVVTTTSATGSVSVSGRGFGFAGFVVPNRLVTLAMSAATILTIAANFVALSWFGMWMGVVSKSTPLATLKTIVFVEIIPWFVISFASALLFPLMLLPSLLTAVPTATSRIMFWYPLFTSAVATVLSLAKDIAFLLWARRKLYFEFRERATRTVAPIRLPIPPLLPKTSVPT